MNCETLNYEVSLWILFSDISCEIKYCEETGGTCLSNKNLDMYCKCPKGTEYEKNSGCKGKQR